MFKKLLGSRQARLVALITFVLACLLAWSGTTGSNSGPAQQVFGVVLAPFQQAAALLSGGVGHAVQAQLSAGSLSRQNEELQAENDVLRTKLAAYDDLMAENQSYRAQLNVQADHPGLVTVAAQVVGRDPLALFGRFTANKGTLQGVAVGQPVVSQSGCLVGSVMQATLTECTVMTLLDPDLNVACVAGVSRENGILNGNSVSYLSGLTTLAGLPRDATAAVGDLVSTSGLGGVFPAGLLVGSIAQMEPDVSGKTITAQITPAVQPGRLTGVLIVTGTEG